MPQVKMVSRRLTRIARSGREPEQRGAAVAELSLVVPVVLAVLLVVFDLGRGLHAYISVTNGARDGARVAMRDDRECTLADLTSVAQSGANPYSVTVSVVEAGGTCAVTVDYIYTPILPFTGSVFSLPMVGTLGPLWDGHMSSAMVSK